MRIAWRTGFCTMVTLIEVMVRAVAHPTSTNLAALRRALALEARELARARVWPDTVGALASTAWRVIAAAAPDAPAALLTAAASAAGLRVAPPAATPGLLDRTERLVRSGGPTYIKLGQFIASAEGLLPDEWVRAFAWCRDRAPALDLEVVTGVSSASSAPRRWPGSIPSRSRPGRSDRSTAPACTTGRRWSSRSVGPGSSAGCAPTSVRSRSAAAAAERFSDTAASANLSGFVELFTQLVLEELDFRLEAENLVESRAIFAARGLDYARVPAPIDGMVTERVLAMEHVPGVPYDRAIEPHGEAIDGDALLRLAITGVLTTTLLDGLFHGDLHAGNVLVDADGTFGLVDFGICGRLGAGQREALGRYLFAFAASDAAAQIEAMRAFGAIPDDADTEALVAELSVELERLDDRVDGAITFERLGDTIGRLLAVLIRNGFRMPKELVLFFKNLLYLSGFAASIAPDADLFEIVNDSLGELAAAT